MKSSTSSSKLSINLIVAIVIAIVAIIITLQNSQVVTMRVLAWQFDISLILLLAMNFFAGALLIYMLMFWQHQKLKRENRRLIKQQASKPATSSSAVTAEIK